MYFLVYIDVSLQANNQGLTAWESSHIKVMGMLVVLLRGVNCIFWSHLRRLEREVTTFPHSGIA